MDSTGAAEGATVGGVVAGTSVVRDTATVVDGIREELARRTPVVDEATPAAGFPDVDGVAARLVDDDAVPFEEVVEPQPHATRPATLNHANVLAHRLRRSRCRFGSAFNMTIRSDVEPDFPILSTNPKAGRPR